MLLHFIHQNKVDVTLVYSDIGILAMRSQNEEWTEGRVGAGEGLMREGPLWSPAGGAAIGNEGVKNRTVTARGHTSPTPTDNAASFLLTGCLWGAINLTPTNRYLSLPFSVKEGLGHTCTVPSLLAEATRVPSGDQATMFTCLL